MSMKTNPFVSIAGLIAATAFAFTACSDASTAATEADAINEKNRELAEAGREVVSAPSGVVVENISHGGVSTVHTNTPDYERTITPAGWLVIDSVETVDYASIAEVDMDTSAGQHVSVEDAPTDVEPAEGEVFRVIDYRFIPRVDSSGDQHTATLTLHGAGQQHIKELNTERDERILVSVPEDGDGYLSIASEGHEQKIDVLTGERVLDDTDPAAGYYRDITDYELQHTFHMDDDVVQVVRTSGSSNEVEDAVVQYDTRVRTITLTGWTPQNGWAPEGQAWMIIDWDYNVSTDFLNGMGAALEETDLTLSAEFPDGTTVEDRVVNELSSGDSAAQSVMAVPVDAKDFTLSVEGTTEFRITDLNYDVVSGEETTLTMAPEPVEVSLPDTGTTTDTTPEDE